MSINKDKRVEDADEDHLFLDQVLNKLYDFGDGEKRWNASRKRKKEVYKSNDAERDMEAEEGSDAVEPNTQRERESRESRNKLDNVEVVVFVDPLKKKSIFAKTMEPSSKDTDEKEKKTHSEERLTIEKARFEVHRFGLSGFEKQQQRLFEQERAIMLGARPPKKQYVNYKVYQQNLKGQKKREKEEEKSEPQKQRRKERNPRKSSSTREVGGQVGRFKDGMLVLSSKEMQKFNIKLNK